MNNSFDSRRTPTNSPVRFRQDAIKLTPRSTNRGALIMLSEDFSPVDALKHDHIAPYIRIDGGD
jgi:hypothetical protein